MIRMESRGKVDNNHIFFLGAILVVRDGILGLAVLDVAKAINSLAISTCSGGREEEVARDICLGHKATRHFSVFYIYLTRAARAI